MSEHEPTFEHLNDSPEHHEKHHDNHEKHAEKHEKTGESSHEEEKKLDIEEIRHEVEKQEEEMVVPVAEVQTEQPTHVAPPNAELKKVTFNNTMSKIRRQLPTSQRAFSKVIHQPAVDKISELTGKTVFRPVGFTTGAFIGLVGSTFVLYLSRHYGFKYNYITFLVFFLGGLIIGLVGELLFRLFRLRSSKHKTS